jgi:trigger factor
MTMQVSLSTTQGLERRLEVQVPPEAFLGAIESRLRDIARNARLKGFRPGKAPLPVVRAQFGPQVREEVLGELMQSSFSEAVSQQQLRPATNPRIDNVVAANETGLSFVATFEVLPEVRIKPLEQIVIEKPQAEITEADLEAMIDSMRRQQPVFTPIERAAEPNDRVTVDFVGTLDGVAFEGGSGTDIPFVVGAGRMLAAFEEGVKGLKAGESRNTEVPFPADYGSANLAGKTAQFAITVKKVEAQSLPEVNDEFVSLFGVKEGGVEAFRKEVRASMEREMEQAVRTQLRRQVMDALYRDNALELPRSLLEETIQELQLEMARRMGVRDASQLPPRDPFEEPARRRVTLGLLMAELIKAQNIQLDRARVQSQLAEIVAAYPNAEEMRRQYLQSPDAMRQIENQVREDQVIDWLLGQVKQVTKASSFKELTRFGSEASTS